ncbi:MAG: hypothetical protein AAFX86_13545 [Pseudomonadota bacterium]
MIPAHWSAYVHRPPLQVAAGIVLTVSVLAVWGMATWNGLSPGNDDMMRLVQIRDLMAGQDWFDVSQSRFDTPEGGAMHWSRVPDLFIGGLILALTPFLGAEGAEHAVLALWPRLVLAGTLTAIAVALHRLGAGRAGIAAGLIVFMVSHAVVQFQPGRIDHHGLELMLVLSAFAALCGPARGWRTGVFVAGCVALMLTIAMESLPYAAGLIVLGGVLWVLNGTRDVRLLTGLGVGLSGFAILAYVFDAPGMTGLRAVCDAYGNVHAAALVIGGLGLFGLGFADARLSNWRARLAAGVGVGVAAALSALAIDPSCLGSPYSAVDAAIMDGWMTSVTEARDIVRLFETSPAFGLAAFGFAIIGALAAGLFLKLDPKADRALIMGLVGLTLLAILVTSWQVRAVMFAHGFAVIGAGLAANVLIARLMSETGTARVAAMAGLVALSPTTWQTAGTQLFAKTTQLSDTSSSRAECRSADAMAALAALPPSRVFTPVDLGTAVLAHTDHTVFAAPYHRNPGSIGRALSVFESAPAEARELLQASGADVLYACPGIGELKLYARRSPDSLAAALEAGDLPNWLEQGGDAEDGVLFLRVRQDAVAEATAR